MNGNKAKFSNPSQSIRRESLKINKDGMRLVSIQPDSLGRELFSADNK